MRRARYRLSQFVTYFYPRPLGAEEAAEAERLLGPALAELFRRQSAGEQAHSWQVMQTVARGDGRYARRRELLQAALLHDVGKSRAPLTLLDRVMVVLARRLAPQTVERWSAPSAAGQPRGWRRPFVTARCHAAWGAELCAAAGAPPLTVSLVRRHQTPVLRPANPEDEMLVMLQAADDDN